MLNKQSITVHDLPKEERPRERLKRFGAEALSQQELLAIIIGRGSPNKSVLTIAQDLLVKFKNIQTISQATVEELSQVEGIGEAKALQIKACFELARRQDLNKDVLLENYLENSKSVIELIQNQLKDKTKEHFKLIMLNTRNKVINIADISTGTLNASLVHPREVFIEAIKHHSCAVILVHNHPSGEAEPSNDDLKITKRLKEAGNIIGIEVLDHIIIGKDNYFSFKDNQLI
ncbi:MAG: DNA repair protein RadC [candidate division WOR-3 bacterium]